MPYSDEELLEDLRRVGDEVGHVPSIKEYRQKGQHSDKTYFERFGSWQAAQEAAGYRSNNSDRKISDDELLEEINRLADELGHRPSSSEMNQQGRFWKSTYQDHFSTWSAALEEAGFEAPGSEIEISDEEIYEDIRRVAAKLDKAPSIREMNNHGKYSPPTYSRPCGTWTKTREAALE
jgi:hypothetical protein